MYPLSKPSEVSEADSDAAPLRGASCVLFDFDGPICKLFAGHDAAGIAETIKSELAREQRLPAELATSENPHGILQDLWKCLVREGRLPGEAHEAVLRVGELLAAEEMRAAESARRTEGTTEVLHQLQRAGVPMAIVTNNSADAVRHYLCREELSEYFGDHVYGRQPDPQLMKPNPYSLRRAMTTLGFEPKQCVMVGDSFADVQAAEAAGVAFVGYAPNERKRRMLQPPRSQGAHVVVSMAELCSLRAPILHP